MQISNRNYVSFGYSSPLKTLFKDGQMPTVKNGIYGNPINPTNVSLEHLKPFSQGGKTELRNLPLADSKANAARGSKPITQFLSTPMVNDYLSQFNFNVPGKFNGFQYQKLIRETCANLNIGEDVKEKLVIPQPKPKEIDFGNIKEVMSHLGEFDLSRLSKKMLKAVKNRLSKQGKSLDLFI